MSRAMNGQGTVTPIKHGEEQMVRTEEFGQDTKVTAQLRKANEAFKKHTQSGPAF